MKYQISFLLNFSFKMQHFYQPFLRSYKVIESQSDPMNSSAYIKIVY